MKINIYINVAVVGSVNVVLNRLLKLIYRSGLINNSNFLKLIVNGSINDLKISPEYLCDKLIVIHANNHIDHCEFPGLYELWRDAQESDHYALYLHTKGVSKKVKYFVRNWVDYLSYFNIEKWQDRVADLSFFESTGVNLKGDPKYLQEENNKWGYLCAPLHYSGNFWWSTSAYIRTLPEPYGWGPDTNYKERRILCEMWLLQNSKKHKDVWQSGVKHYMGEPYPSFMYRSELYNRGLYFLFKNIFRLYIRMMRKLK